MQGLDYQIIKIGKVSFMQQGEEGSANPLLTYFLIKYKYSNG